LLRTKYTSNENSDEKYASLVDPFCQYEPEGILHDGLFRGCILEEEGADFLEHGWDLDFGGLYPEVPKSKKKCRELF
jgi:hypothetical protein